MVALIHNAGYSYRVVIVGEERLDNMDAGEGFPHLCRYLISGTEGNALEAALAYAEYLGAETVKVRRCPPHPTWMTDN